MGIATKLGRVAGRTICFLAIPSCAILLGAIGVDIQSMVANSEVMFDSSFFLPDFYRSIEELFNMAALQAHDMVVMCAAVEFEDRFPAFEMMLHQQPCLLELREYAIDSGKAHDLTRTDELLVDIFRAQMSFFTRFKQLQDLESRQGGFKSCILEVVRLVHSYSLSF